MRDCCNVSKKTDRRNKSQEQLLLSAVAAARVASAKVEIPGAPYGKNHDPFRLRQLGHANKQSRGEFELLPQLPDNYIYQASQQVCY